jgi:hypothetical protein
MELAVVAVVVESEYRDHTSTHIFLLDNIGGNFHIEHTNKGGMTL